MTSVYDTVCAAIKTALDAVYVKKSSTSGLLKNDGTVDSNSYLTTSSASSTYQPKLVSGTNIKTINSESILGSGDITIQGGSGGSCVSDFYIDSQTDEWVISTSACSQGEVVTSWELTLSDEKVPSEKLVKNYVDGLVGDAITYIVGSG